MLQYYNIADGETRDIQLQEIPGLVQEDSSVLLVTGMRGIPLATLRSVVLAVAKRKVLREHKRIDAMIDACLDVENFAPIEAKIEDDNARLRSGFVKDFEMLTSYQIHERSGSSSKNKAARASDWKKAQKIFSVKIHGKELYPAFQFDADDRPLPLVNPVLKHLQGEHSPWQIAFWLVSPLNALDGRPPIDLVRDGDKRVVEAAAHAYELPTG